MGYYYNDSDSTERLVRDIEDNYTPDSVREDAVRELRSRGIDCNVSGYVNYDDLD